MNRDQDNRDRNQQQQGNPGQRPGQEQQGGGTKNPGQQQQNPNLRHPDYEDDDRTPSG
ncbi:hypothetical protein G5V57_24270 [Nordella sp. HKS 07]|uniref:hypothetical protein n=1 Tax=Nordella sp. HKS 07 TaxID=2712222 RepID=UPI0013E1FF12|nr:hypothetical protein [Nordella sp. HKS 07]QIG50570.1 hypothetical protein G5V57_24270 [Nordella sp. HKS 07]